MTIASKWLFTLFAIATCVNAFGAVPHQFQSGTPARASEVNANFSNIDGRVSEVEAQSASQEAAITDLQQQQAEHDAAIQQHEDQLTEIDGEIAALQSAPPPFQIIDSNGEVIGKPLTLFVNPQSALVLLSVSTSWGEEDILVRASNRFLLQAESNYPQVFYHATDDCSGSRYIADFSTETWFAGLTPYILDTNPGDSGVYANLTVADTTQASFDLTAYSSSSLNGSCQQFPSGNVFRVFPSAAVGDLHLIWPPPYAIRFE